MVQVSETLTHDQIEALWVQFGGRKGAADMAASIAQAESGGSLIATNDNGNGSVDRGLFQINSSHGALSSYDIETNIKAAIAISADGVNWHPWCTAWSDNACGSKGGSYLGSGASFHQFITGSYSPADVKAVKGSDGAWSIVDGQGKPIASGGSQGDTADPQGITGGIATGVAHKALGWTEALGKVLAHLLDPLFWLRIGQGLASAALLLIGFGLVFRKDVVSGIVSAVAPEAKAAGAASSAVSAAGSAA